MTRDSIALDEVPYVLVDSNEEGISVSNAHRRSHRHHHNRASEEDKEKMNAFESLDFHSPDTLVWRNWAIATPKKTWMEKTLGKWLVCMAIGLVVGCLAYMIRWCVEGLNETKYEISNHYLKKNGATGFFIYYAMNIGFSTISYIFVGIFGSSASSSGIPEVTGYLNGVRVPKTFNIKTFFAKVASLIFSYASSLALGPEGPMIHLGALVGSSLGPLKSKTLGLYSKVGWKFGNDTDKRDFISSGAAAGISAAFGAPIGGTLFALEEATSFWSRQLGWRTFFCCMCSAFTVNGILQARAGTQEVQDYGLLTFGFSTAYLYRYAELLPFSIIGVVGGVVGALFVKFNSRLNEWRNGFFPKRHRIYRLLEVLAVVTLASVLSFGISAAFPCRSRHNLVMDSSSNDVCDAQEDSTLHLQAMFCDEETQYNDMASILWTPPNVALPLLYHRDTGVFTLPALGIFAFVYFFLAVLSSGLYVAGGLFIPMMLVGGSLGRFMGNIMLAIFPHVQPPIDPSIYALVGSAAVMTGFCRMTISLVVILVELTEGTQYLLPIILVVMIAKWIGDYCSHSIYHKLIEMKGFPFLENNPPKEYVARSVTDFMEKNVVKFEEIEKVSTIAQVLGDTRHHGFPVIAREGGRFKGMILRNQLLVLLQNKIFVEDNSQEMQPDVKFSYPQFSDLLTRKLPDPRSIKFSGNEFEMYVDLRPYLNNSTITVNTSFSFGNVYSLFRTMGLRHLPVLNDEHLVAGILTRKDLL